MPPKHGSVIAGRYRMERPLASGGMGSVWVARHQELDVAVAVKLMSDEVDVHPSGRARFEREAKAAARLQSPHVARVHDYGVADGTPYIAMELLEGESLEARLRRVERMAPDEASTILRQLSKGLREAHDHGIVHRDLKPANIFLAIVGEDEVVKILDFGVAKETKTQLVDDDTSAGVLVGSPHYMSPEQARGGDVDARSDLWSLAVVMFRCLTGRRLFAGGNVGDVIARICADDIPAPSAFAPELAPAIDRFFAKALARNPSLRFQSAREMANAFDEALGKKIAPEARTPRSAPPTPLPSAVTPRSEITQPVECAPTAPPSKAVGLEVTIVSTTTDHAVIPASSRSSLRPLAIALGLAAAAVAAYVGWSRSHSSTASATREPSALTATAPDAHAPLAVVTPIVSAAAPEAPSAASTDAPAPTSEPARGPAVRRKPSAPASTPRLSPVSPKPTRRTNDPFF